uniref:Uncharacterized protein n=1 Tax=Timema poppense TaxID=170557 RepID=A0A7R9HDK5_TIMPO|nr:unnamed protein product [Timema poppensis]
MSLYIPLHFLADVLIYTTPLPEWCPYIYRCASWVMSSLPDVKELVDVCPDLVELDMSDCISLTAETISHVCQLSKLEHLALSRCYSIPRSAYFSFSTQDIKTVIISWDSKNTEGHHAQEKGRRKEASLPHVSAPPVYWQNTPSLDSKGLFQKLRSTSSCSPVSLDQQLEYDVPASGGFVSETETDSDSTGMKHLEDSCQRLRQTVTVLG